MIAESHFKQGRVCRVSGQSCSEQPEQGRKSLSQDSETMSRGSVSLSQCNESLSQGNESLSQGTVYSSGDTVDTQDVAEMAFRSICALEPDDHLLATSELFSAYCLKEGVVVRDDFLYLAAKAMKYLQESGRSNIL